MRKAIELLYKFKADLLRTIRKAAGNMRLAQWGVTCKIESSCFYLALVHIDSLVLLSPPLRQAQKRWR